MLELEKLKKAQEKKRKADQRLARAQLESNTAEKTEKELARRIDRRRKAILGGLLMKAENEGAIQPDFIRGLIRKFAPERDKKAFAETAWSVSETFAGPPSPPSDG